MQEAYSLDSDALSADSINPISHNDSEKMADDSENGLPAIEIYDSPDILPESSPATTQTDIRWSTTPEPLDRFIKELENDNSSGFVPDSSLTSSTTPEPSDRLIKEMGASNSPGVVLDSSLTSSSTPEPSDRLIKAVGAGNSPGIVLDPSATISTPTASEKGGDAITVSLSRLPEQEQVQPPVVSSIADVVMELTTWQDVGKSARVFGVLTLLLFLSTRYNLIGVACLAHIGILVYHAIQRQRRHMAEMAVRVENFSDGQSIEDAIQGVAEDACPNCLMPRLRQCVADVAACEYWLRGRDFVINGLNLSRPINTAALVAASLVCISVGQSVNITLCLVFYMTTLLLPLGYKIYLAMREARTDKINRRMEMWKARTDKINRLKEQKEE